MDDRASQRSSDALPGQDGLRGLLAAGTRETIQEAPWRSRLGSARRTAAEPRAVVGCEAAAARLHRLAGQGKVASGCDGGRRECVVKPRGDRRRAVDQAAGPREAGRQDHRVGSSWSGASGCSTASRTSVRTFARVSAASRGHALTMRASSGSLEGESSDRAPPGAPPRTVTPLFPAFAAPVRLLSSPLMIPPASASIGTKPLETGACVVSWGPRSPSIQASAVRGLPIP